MISKCYEVSLPQYKYVMLQSSLYDEKKRNKKETNKQNEMRAQFNMPSYVTHTLIGWAAIFTVVRSSRLTWV